MVQESRKYRINEEGNKEKYLKYFFVDGTGENQAVRKEQPEADKKTCIYCGSIHVPQYSLEAFEVCENCYAQLLSSRQEFEEVLYQTKENLEQLMGVFVNQSVGVVYKNGWLSQHKRYFGKEKKSDFEKKEKDTFIKNLVMVSKSKKYIEFVVHEKMPRSIFMYLVAESIIGALLEKKIVGLEEDMIYHPLKCAVMKWCALRYMELNGYTDFCQCKNQEELKDAEYKKLVEEIESSLEGSEKSMDDIVDFLKENRSVTASNTMFSRIGEENRGQDER